MIFMIYLSFMIFLITFLIMLLASFFSKKSISDREKNSPFECGFDPKSSSRLPFSLRFFLIAIIFLIFDVEIALLTPMIIILNYSNFMNWIMSSLFFIFILLMGLFHEWIQGSLKWSN